MVMVIPMVKMEKNLQRKKRKTDIITKFPLLVSDKIMLTEEYDSIITQKEERKINVFLKKIKVLANLVSYFVQIIIC